MNRRPRAGGGSAKARRRKTVTLERRNAPKTARRRRSSAPGRETQVARSNGKHLLGLINDVLDLSKIEAGQLTLSLSDYSLAELVQGAYVAVESLAAQKNLAQTANIAKGLPVGHGDERRLAQVLLNLIGIAIKFSEVSIEASLSGGSFRIVARVAAGRSGFVFTANQSVGDHIGGHLRFWRLGSDAMTL